MTEEQARTRELSRKLRDAVMRAPVDIDAAEAMEPLLAQALAARERAVWLEAAKAVENGHFLTNESMEYKWGQQVAAMLRRMAEAVQP